MWRKETGNYFHEYLWNWGLFPFPLDTIDKFNEVQLFWNIWKGFEQSKSPSMKSDLKYWKKIVLFPNECLSTSFNKVYSIIYHVLEINLQSTLWYFGTVCLVVLVFTDHLWMSESFELQFLCHIKMHWTISY